MIRSRIYTTMHPVTIVTPTQLTISQYSTIICLHSKHHRRLKTTSAETVELDTKETDTIDSEHGTIYYEHKRVHEVPPLHNPLPETIHTDRTHQSEAENQSDEIDIPSPDHEPEQRFQPNNDAASTTSSAETSQPITRNNITRYSLREAPVPKTFNNFLVHELQAKPALLKFMQRKSENQ